MLLTLSNPVKSDFEYKPHDYSPPFYPSKVARYPPQLDRGPKSAQASISSYAAMSTPHRGLPPPSAMTLPDPGQPHSSMPNPLGALPPAPSQWQGAEDGMKNWLAAKAEEERRRQEEERTHQESLKLEQRKIEHSMLRESMQGGVPPHLVPIIFAGIGGGHLANISAEWIQQYTATVQAAHQQVQIQAQAQLSPDLRRDSRMIGQPSSSVYGGQPHAPQTVLPPTAVLPGQPLSVQPQQAPAAYSGVMSPRSRAAGVLGAPTSAPRPAPQSQLPRLTTNDMNIQQPPTAPFHSQQSQSQSAQQEQSSPSIYFHHWVPPSSSGQEKPSSGNPPATPSGKYKASPVYQSRQHTTSHASDPEFASSPKKRKAQGPHPPPPPPTSAPQSHTSPSFSHVSASSTSTPGQRGHARGRSDASARGQEASSAPVSRRGTVSGLAQEAMMRQGDYSEGARHSEHKSHQHPHSDQASYYPTSPRRSESRQHSAFQLASKPEIPNYGAHQHWDRAYISSPKREAGDH
ncbi:hypothetical protein BDU57DRAFT_139210 [Ampelomyces quisqualis]|uniref:Uncharacterized protein n=1 Tax=Ampelomyces quisqualis TaxID=50730 RepID=A0A6A5QZS3_AMPQU|nr:hypothetical protein BDU57DRAFT_139210 [Ampelomyces quisqualis]